MAAILSGNRESPGSGASRLEADLGFWEEPRYRFGEFEVQPAAGLLLRLGRRIRIQDLPFRMLVVLLQAPGDIVSREELRNRLWGEKTFVEFDNNLRVAAAKLREALQDSATEPRYLETIARRGYRFLATVEVILPPTLETPASTPSEAASAEFSPPLYIEGASAADNLSPSDPKPRRHAAILFVFLAAFILLGLIFGLWRWRHRPLLAVGNVVALGAIQNATGDPTLDDALSLGFRIKMEESPFIHAISSERFEQTSLHLRTDQIQGQDAGSAELSACRSLGGNLLLHGTLLRAGSGFDVRLAALRCKDGREIISTRSHAATSNALLKALDTAGDALRLRLGETPSMLGRFDVPLTQATTNSLAAQRAFRAGEQLHVTGRDLEARASYKLAVDLDPKFAMGYLQLGRIYSNTGESALSRSYYQKAFDLRERTTDREKLYIATSYYGYVTGEIDRAIGAYQLWQSLYPNDVVPVNNLAIEYITLGEGDKAVAEARKAVELEPQLPVPYATLAQALFMAGDYRTLAVLCNDKARSAGPTMVLPLTCHEFSIVENDTVRQAEIERASEGKPLEAYILNDTAEAEAYSGHLRHATQLFAKSVSSARNHDLPELAAMLELNAVSIRASLDDPTASQSLIEDALLHSPGGAQVFTGAALAYAVMHHSG